MTSFENELERLNNVSEKLSTCHALAFASSELSCPLCSDSGLRVANSLGSEQILELPKISFYHYE